MTWNSRYRLARHLRSSLWIIPIGAVILHLLASRVVHTLDARLGWEGSGLGIDGAKALANAVITFALSFVVFTFGSLLVAIQVASGQYTPRIIATTLLRDNVIRYTVGLFIFTLLFAIKALNRIESTVPQLVIVVTALLGVICLLAFLFLIDYAARMLRPVSLVKSVGDQGLDVIDSVFPDKLAELGSSEAVEPAAQKAIGSQHNPGPVARTVPHRGTFATVLAVDIRGLIADAEKANGVIELAPEVGDFASFEEPLFRLYGGAAAISDERLRERVVFGIERTLHQDPLFAFRILVDIAIKALSAAINDPTTAVLAIDQLHRLLRAAGSRKLHDAQILDRSGALRVLLRTPDWNDFVKLSFTEIRFCGTSSMQIARRLRAMIIHLGHILPAERRPALSEELELLDDMVLKLFVHPKDLALARIPDFQGLGGSNPMFAKWASDSKSEVPIT